MCEEKWLRYENLQRFDRPAIMLQALPNSPYDVCDADEARAVAAHRPHSFFHVSKPEIDLSASTDPYSPVVYETAQKNFKQFISDGILVEDSAPKLFLYTLVMNGRAQTGLVTCVSIDDYTNNIVKKHEFTREDKEIDRMKHLDMLSAHTGLVFLFYRQELRKKALFDRASQLPALYDVTADDGVRHIIREISDPLQIAEFKSAFKDDILYIADGHHRAASAVKVGLKRRAENDHNTGSEEYNWFLSVVFPHDELMIMPYNRVLKDFNGRSRDDFFDELSKLFSIEKTSADVPPAKGTFAFYTDATWYMLTPLFAITGDAVARLDVSVLQDKVLSPLFGIDDPRRDKRINFIGGIRGTAELVKLVDSGKYSAAFSMFPTSIVDLMDVSDSGEVMPPKSTWFEPKLRDGLLSHRF